MLKFENQINFDQNTQKSKLYIIVKYININRLQQKYISLKY